MYFVVNALSGKTNYYIGSIFCLHSLVLCMNSSPQTIFLVLNSYSFIRFRQSPAMNRYLTKYTCTKSTSLHFTSTAPLKPSVLGIS